MMSKVERENEIVLNRAYVAVLEGTWIINCGLSAVMKRPKQRSNLSKTVNLLKAATFARHTCLKPFYWGTFIGQTVIESY